MSLLHFLLIVISSRLWTRSCLQNPQRMFRYVPSTCITPICFTTQTVACILSGLISHCLSLSDKPADYHRTFFVHQLLLIIAVCTLSSDTLSSIYSFLFVEWTVTRSLICSCNIKTCDKEEKRNNGVSCIQSPR